jgi:23S rRNA pseudouridine2605 synthase
MPTFRINKFLAHATGMSRRQADDAVAHGKVAINGHVADMGAQVEENATVTLNGVIVGAQRSYTYLLLHKPVEYVCSRRRQGETPTIYELLPQNYRSLKAVGRLDKDSSGLLFMTDDGDFAHSMTHPKFAKTKVYEVGLSKPLEPLHQQMISDHGITLEDGISKLMIERLGQGEDNKRYQVTMHEGRNRQIRRTFGSLGYAVKKLHRISFGNYSLGDMKTGEYKIVNIH